MSPGIAKLMLDSLSVCRLYDATASSIARGRLGYLAGIAGLTGRVGILLNAPDARALAHSYRDLFGWPLADDEREW